jgi:MFS transporter, DHA1 family, multidrug resistance protein
MNAQPPGALLVVNLLAQIAFGLLTMTICIPSMAQWGALLGASQGSVALTFSAYVVAYGGLQLVYGPLSDRLGRKAVLLVGLALAFAGAVTAALATDVWTLTLGRVLQGAGGAAGAVAGRALVQDLFHGAERTRVLAYVGMAMGLCPPLATVLGGALHVRLGWQSNFVLMALLAALLALAAWRGLPGPVRRAATPGVVPVHWWPEMLAAYRRLGSEPVFVLHVLVMAMTTATFYAFLAGAPSVLGHLGVAPDGVGYYIMLGPLSYIVGNYTTSRWVHRAGERAMMRRGQACTVAGVGLMLVLGLAGARYPLAFALPLMLMGLGHGLLVAPAMAGTVGLVPALAGSAAALAGLFQQLLGAAGGYGAGLLDHRSAVPLGAWMLALSVAGALAHWWLFRPPGLAASEPGVGPAAAPGGRDRPP